MAWSLEAFREHMQKPEADQVVELNTPLMEELGVFAGKCTPSKKSKWNNVETEVDGITFDSAKEARDYGGLKVLEREGLIRDLKLQVTFLLKEGFRDERGKKHRDITYIADFVFFDTHRNKWVVKDSKGAKTDVFRMKEKMFIERYGDQYIFEVG